MKSCVFRVAAAVLAASCMAGFAPAARALPTEFLLKDVTFSDGGTASGYFGINGSGYFSGGEIVTTGGSVLGGATYNGDHVAGTISADGLSVTMFGGGYGEWLRLTFSELLETAAPNDQLQIVTGAASVECAGYASVSGACQTLTPQRDVIAGFVTAVPEPLSLALLGGGVLALAGVRRRNA